MDVMTSISIRKHDQVTVLAGKDKGKQGRVLMVMMSKGRALVENVNKIKRHTRPNPAKGIKGGIVEREASIHVSNLMVICPECEKPTRVGHAKDDAGRKVRTCKKCRAQIERKASA